MIFDKMAYISFKILVILRSDTKNVKEFYYDA